MIKKLTPEFVKYMPESLEDGKIYISLEFKSAIHKCCCGCGYKSVTPFNEGGWQLTNSDGQITLNPSILNTWCQSHYWIRNNEVVWA